MTTEATPRTTGAARIRWAFDAARRDDRAALVPYVVAGRPAPSACVELVARMAEAGADVIELGVPFSDPLADGAVIRDATRRSLDGGMTVAGVLDLARGVRDRGVDVPLVCMGYANPLLAYGIDRFCADAAAAGVDGLIVPDVPLGAGRELRRSAERAGLGMTFLVTPLTESGRIPELAAASTGFLYAVAATGTTGARSDLAGSTIELLERLASLDVDAPIAVGFGISTPEQVERLAPIVDGVIVGSALVDLVERDPQAALELVAALRRATRRPL